MRNKKGQFVKGIVPWNKGKKGVQVAWNKGKEYLAIKGAKHHMYGKKPSESSLKKMSVSWFKIGENRGDKNVNWKGGVVSENKAQRIEFKKRLQRAIFERDGYNCQTCNSRKDLQVDHIKSWADFPELRFDPDNCRTLCAKCHYKITFHRNMPENVRTWGHNLKLVDERRVNL